MLYDQVNNVNVWLVRKDIRTGMIAWAWAAAITLLLMWGGILPTPHWLTWWLIPVIVFFPCSLSVASAALLVVSRAVYILSVLLLAIISLDGNSFED